MNILDQANESKKRTALMNNIGIDWRYAQELIPTVLNQSKEHTTEFKNNAIILQELLIGIEEGVKEIKRLIPNFDVDIE